MTENLNLKTTIVRFNLEVKDSVYKINLESLTGEKFKLCAHMTGTHFVELLTSANTNKWFPADSPAGIEFIDQLTEPQEKEIEVKVKSSLMDLSSSSKKVKLINRLNDFIPRGWELIPDEVNSILKGNRRFMFTITGKHGFYRCKIRMSPRT